MTNRLLALGLLALADGFTTQRQLRLVSRVSAFPDGLPEIPLAWLESGRESFSQLQQQLPTELKLPDDFNVDAAVTFISAPWHLGVVAALAVGNALIRFLMAPDGYLESPYPPGTTTYDPQAAADFYSKRPLLVIKRVLRLALLTGAFNTGLLFDWLVLGKLFKDEEYKALRRNEPRRAKEALELCQQLGPTFIKLGQALSIRQDLVPEAYANELRQLQDRVPPFSNEEAYRVLRNELGVEDLSLIFAELTPEPVASASIGQVYRGRLAATGQDVAVKVQRPGILGEIALDLFVLRTLTPIQTTLQNLANRVETTQADIDTALLLVDEWGRGFVAETDYQLEAKNTIEFRKAMEARGLDAVTAPKIVDNLVRDKVLVTEWVNGKRLDLDTSPDVPRLCGVAINAYLTMLLDTGVLHCDPHKVRLLPVNCCLMEAPHTNKCLPGQPVANNGRSTVYSGLGDDFGGTQQFTVCAARVDCSYQCGRLRCHSARLY